MNKYKTLSSNLNFVDALNFFPPRSKRSWLIWTNIKNTQIVWYRLILQYHTRTPKHEQLYPYLIILTLHN